MLRTRHLGQSLVIALAFMAAACSSSSTAATSPTPIAGSLPQASSATAQKPTVNPSATPTTVDPCQLVTSQEASSMTGASYGAGVPQTYDGGSKGCIYGYQTLNVFSVLVAQADSPQTAQADWAQEQAQAQVVLAKAAGAASNLNVNTNDVSNVSGADKAAVGSGSFPFGGRTFNVSVMYLIKGSVFVTFSDISVGVAAPSAGSMESQAAAVVGRLP